MKSGRKLIAEIENYEVKPGGLAFWWLGQHSYALKTAKHVFYLDPYLSPDPNRLLESPLKPEEVSNAFLITGSHDHGDHIDHPALPALMKASPRSVLLVPKAAKASVEKDGLDMGRVVALDDGDVYEKGGVKITAIKAAHELFDKQKGLGYPYLGFVIEADGATVYHAGDSCDYDGLARRLRKWKLSAAFLPVNGRDAVRLKANCIGNMTYQEAVDLAGSIKLGTAIPSHYGMFAFNTQDPQLFADYLAVKYPAVRCSIPKFAEPVEISASAKLK